MRILTANSEANARIELIKNRIVREVSAYFASQKVPIRMQILSAKFSRKCNEINGLDGFPELISELSQSGRIRIEYTANGARNVYPADLEISDADREEPWY